MTCRKVHSCPTTATTGGTARTGSSCKVPKHQRGAEAPAGTGDVTADDLTPVGDTGVEPGDESKLDERLKPYFEPDYDSVEDDTSSAEQAEVMDDSQYTGSASSSSSQSSAGEPSAAGESPSPEGGN